MTWLRIAFEDAMTHCCPASLLPDLVIEMARRGSPIKNFEADFKRETAAKLGGNPAVIDKWSFDIGGGWYVGEPEETITVDGLSIRVPCAQFLPILSEVRRSVERRFDDGASYHKLKFWCHATVLTPEQHRDVRVQLETIVPLAQKRYAEWDSERKARAQS